jgi:hypothetical protein
MRARGVVVRGGPDTVEGIGLGAGIVRASVHDDAEIAHRAEGGYPRRPAAEDALEVPERFLLPAEEGRLQRDAYAEPRAGLETLLRD